MKRLSFCLFAWSLLFSVGAMAYSEMADVATKSILAQRSSKRSSYSSTPTYYAPSAESGFARNHEPWDVSFMLGLYNPGFGFEGLGAYRVVDSLVPSLNVDNSLSVEAGLGYWSANDTVAGISISYSEVEIPLMARWDFHLLDNKFIVGPRAGFEILTAGQATVNNVTYTARGGGVYVQIGGDAMYLFDEHWAARIQLMFINYTSFSFGGSFFF